MHRSAYIINLERRLMWLKNKFAKSLEFPFRGRYGFENYLYSLFYLRKAKSRYGKLSLNTFS